MSPNPSEAAPEAPHPLETADPETLAEFGYHLAELLADLYRKRRRTAVRASERLV